MITYTDTKAANSFALDELIPGTRHFVTIKSKIAEGKNKNGTPFYPTRGIEYFVTKAGEIELSLWLSLVEEAVKNEGKEPLYNTLVTYTKNNCGWLKKDKDIRLHAAEVLLHKSYENWDIN